MTASRWLASLVTKLRAAGLTVSPARLLDAARVLVETGDLATDRETLRMMLAVTLVSKRAWRPAFDEVFSTFMAAHGPPRPAPPKRSPKGHAGAVDAGRGGAGARHDGEGLPHASVREPDGGKGLRRDVLRFEDEGRPRGTGDEADESLRGREGEASRRASQVDALRQVSDADAPWEASEAEALLRRAEEEWRRDEAEVARRSERYGEPSRRADAEGFRLPPGPAAPHGSAVSRGQTARASQGGRPGRRGPVDTLPRPPLTPDTLAAVRRMASALWLRRSRRSRRFKRGRIDLKATLAHSVRTDATPLRLVHRRRRLKRARLLLLLDVSGSMRQAAPFVLALTAGLREAFVSVGAFAFVDHPVELRGDELPTDEVNWMSQSDYGHTFFKLLTEHERLLRKDVVVVVMGDARNNFSDPMTWALAEIRGRVGALLWLNPEARGRWNTGDSVIGAYAPWCDRVLRCATTADLKEAAEALLAQAARWR